MLCVVKLKVATSSLAVHAIMGVFTKLVIERVKTRHTENKLQGQLAK